MGVPLVVHYWVDLQSVHRFHCYDTIARTRNVSKCLYLLYAWFLYCPSRSPEIVDRVFSFDHLMPVATPTVVCMCIDMWYSYVSLF